MAQSEAVRSWNRAAVHRHWYSQADAIWKSLIEANWKKLTLQHSQYYFFGSDKHISIFFAKRFLSLTRTTDGSYTFSKKANVFFACSAVKYCMFSVFLVVRDYEWKNEKKMNCVERLKWTWAKVFWLICRVPNDPTCVVHITDFVFFLVGLRWYSLRRSWAETCGSRIGWWIVVTINKTAQFQEQTTSLLVAFSNPIVWRTALINRANHRQRRQLRTPYMKNVHRSINRYIRLFVFPYVCTQSDNRHTLAVCVFVWRLSVSLHACWSKEIGRANAWKKTSVSNRIYRARISDAGIPSAILPFRHNTKEEIIKIYHRLSDPDVGVLNYVVLQIEYNYPNALQRIFHFSLFVLRHSQKK